MELNIAPVLKDYLKEMLLKASVTGEIINVTGYHRGIGKSTAIVEFAKEFGLTAIVNHRNTKARLMHETGYDKIIVQNEIGGQPIDSRFVHDEDVDLSRFKNINIVTGFNRTN